MPSNETEATVENLLDAGDLKGAKRILHHMLEVDPDSLAAHFHLARVYRRKRQYGRALLHGRRALRLNPNEPNANLNIALVYDLMEDKAGAVRHYKRELSRDPYSGLTLWNLGRLYFDKRRWKLASGCLQKCLDAGYWTEADETLYKLGYCYCELGKVDEYIRAYERYLGVYPSSAWALANLGRALLRAKRHKKAALRLSRAYILEPRESVAKALLRARKGLTSELSG
jgi:tetratricopeptide (TPR) repeat protein